MGRIVLNNISWTPKGGDLHKNGLNSTPFLFSCLLFVEFPHYFSLSNIFFLFGRITYRLYVNQTTMRTSVYMFIQPQFTSLVYWHCAGLRVLQWLLWMTNIILVRCIWCVLQSMFLHISRGLYNLGLSP